MMHLKRSRAKRIFQRLTKSRCFDLFIVLCVVLLLYVLLKKFPLFEKPAMVRQMRYVLDSENKKYVYHRNMPLIFIGGVPRSGTTLMRAILDAHPEVRCGQETRVVPRMLQQYATWKQNKVEWERLAEGGVTQEVLSNAAAQFCLEVIATHGEPANRFCNKDPLTLKYGVIAKELFPNVKFLFMVRDGRATVHSLITRHVTVTGFDLTSYKESLKKWNTMIKGMFVQCELLGKDKCLIVYYEKLVLEPRKNMERILKFLDLPWNENVLHHEEFINKKHGISLSNVERSTDQVIKAVNLEALAKWVGHIPKDVVNTMGSLAPMLEILGYDPHANPPKYDKIDMKINQGLIENYGGKKDYRLKSDYHYN